MSRYGALCTAIDLFEHIERAMKENGCERLMVNGTVVKGSYIPEDLLTDHAEIELTL